MSRMAATPPKNRASAVNPGAVAEMGSKESWTKGHGPGRMFKPIGANSPTSVRSTHKSGSQGKH